MGVSVKEAIRRLRETKFKRYKFSDINREWIDNYPKTINENGCWIPLYKKPNAHNGYTYIQIEKRSFLLSRLSMCIFYNVDYNNEKINTRHNTGCDKACFWYEHLNPGTQSDNIIDSIKDNTHHNASKSVCPKCNGEYTIKINKTGMNKGLIHRFCRSCDILKKREKKERR